MEKKHFPRRFKAYFPLMLLLASIVFLMPRTPKFAYDYKKGEPWKYETLVAQFDFPILKTDKQINDEREKLSSSIIPYYRHDVALGHKALTAARNLDLGVYQYMRNTLLETLSDIYDTGVLPDYSYTKDTSYVSDYIYIQRDRGHEKVAVGEIFSTATAKETLVRTIRRLNKGCNADSIYSASGLKGLVKPDLAIDRKLTEDMYEAALENISATQGLFKAGHTMIEYGDVVTSEDEQLLDSYKAEFNVSVGYVGSSAYMWIGNLLICLSLVFVLFMAIYYCNYKVFDQTKKYLYLLLMFFLSFVAASTVSKIDQELFYIIPFNLVALYLHAFFKKRMVFVVYLISLVPVLMFSSNGVELFVMYMVSGTVGMFVFERFNKGWLQFVTAFIVFVVMVMVWSAFRLVEGVDSLNNYNVIADMALGALLLVAAYPLIYLFEKIFRLVSTSKLVELSDTSNKLLRLLADKAPGTFQHSLQVMNLADAAARSIDADVPLVRAAALYHDIGKIANPQCFTENESPGVNFHAELTLKESAKDIIRHVSDGIALAEKYHLPQVLKDFIVSHHGTTNTAYFYNRYLNEGGDPSDVEDFYYKGIKPTTKEQVIIMLCDTIEAASRSLKDFSQENISALVDRIIEGKVDECQLSNADISLKELNILKEVIKSYLMQMHHSRVAYPKRTA